jgi:hypothetical protein
VAFRIALAMHLACAFGATATFWIPVAASKGGPLHLRAGRLYVRLIYLTAITGAPLAVWLFARAPEPGARRTAIFLAYLITILVMPVFHGVRVARAARDGRRVGSFAHTALSVSAIVAGVVLCGLAIAWREWPYVLLSPVGPVMGVRALRYSSRMNIGGWREEHIVAMLISGIAVHTALLVFGLGRTLGMHLSGLMLYVPWLLPTVVGLPLLLWAVRKERARLSTTTSPARTTPPR